MLSCLAVAGCRGASPPAPPTVFAPSTRTVPLDVVRRVVEIAPGTRFQASTYGGRVPGPTLRARQGDTIRLRLTNRWHGRQSVAIHGATASIADPTQAAAPGQTLSVDFAFPYPGVFMYHSTTPMILESVASGLFGAVVVEPREGWPTRVDREYVVVRSELYARGGHGVYVLDPLTVRTGQVSHVLFNGGLHELARHPLVAKAAERVRLYLLNAGPNQTSSLHVEGIVFDRVWVGGNPENPMRGLAGVTLPPGGGAVVEFTIPAAGRYLLLEHALNMAIEGAMGLIDASGGGSAGPVDPGPVRPLSAGALLFQRRCAVCHSDRLGDRVGWEGPDLAGVTKRRPAAWLEKWLRTPHANSGQVRISR